MTNKNQTKRSSMLFYYDTATTVTGDIVIEVIIMEG